MFPSNTELLIESDETSLTSITPALWAELLWNTVLIMVIEEACSSEITPPYEALRSWMKEFEIVIEDFELKSARAPSVAKWKSLISVESISMFEVPLTKSRLGITKGVGSFDKM